MKELFKTTKQFKGKVLIEELRRAHTIIVLLALSMILLLCMVGEYLDLQFGLLLAATVLLGLLALISGAIVVRLSKK